MEQSFRDFFRSATSGREPYPYQERFAESSPLPHLLRAPTGSGKTATAVLGWLWRWVSRKPETPRRLVYCLPMRVLVEQSASEAEKWIQALFGGGILKEKMPVHVLMGGVDTEEWFLDPERPAILIGTQDMLLSRALNRGYAASRFHWPIDFGLLNNDCLWVFDEPQLMRSGVSTSAQLAGLRLREALGTFGPCLSVWMSATLEPGWLDTVDFRGRRTGTPLELGQDGYGDDYDPERPLHKRMTASKTLMRLEASLSKEADDREVKAIAADILEQHRKADGSQTLVVMNTVKRATKVFEVLATLRKKAASPKLLLVHSRFRPHERRKLNDELQKKDEAVKDRIIVATQVVEAGVDISARTLVTELAPWPSIVQRIGRCNRTGDDGPGKVFWIDMKGDEKAARPYDLDGLSFARDQMAKLDNRDVSPKALEEFARAEGIVLPFTHTHVLRRRDLLDLFDTSPDLSGNDIDISRFVRGDDPDTDVQVFWRAFGPKLADAPGDQPMPGREELCSVPVGQARDFLGAIAEKKRGMGYVWGHLDDEWVKLDPKQLRPGLTILLPASAGGYSDLGWDPTSTAAVKPHPPENEVKGEAAASDPYSASPAQLTIAEHTQNVCDELMELMKSLQNTVDEWSIHLAKAARWHDVGKALDVCQKAMHGSDTPEKTRLLAKSGRSGRLNYQRYGRTHFRHELGSALAVLQRRQEWPFGIAYLIASHHGRVRLSIRALPGEVTPDNPTARFALGVHDGDPLPEVTLGDGETCEETSLDLGPMQLGGEKSWSGQALKLLAELGPFRLAYLETLLRAADVRASKKEAARA